MEGGQRQTGLERALEVLAMRYEYDEKGRIDGASDAGNLPQFVWARSAEGTVWRFRSDLGDAIVSGVAKLAGRERGWCLEGNENPPPPERLEMIGRLLAGGRAAGPPHREFVTQKTNGRTDLVAEIWSFSETLD